MFHRLLACELFYGLIRGNVAKASADIIKSFRARESSQEDKRKPLTPALEAATASSTALAGVIKFQDLTASHFRNGESHLHAES